MEKPQIEKADLYALNAFMTEHYLPGYLSTLSRDSPASRHFCLPDQNTSGQPWWASDSFRMNGVYDSGNMCGFGISREKRETLLKTDSYYVVVFTYYNNQITVKAGLKDKIDNTLIKDVHATLSERCCNQLIPNLDELVQKE